MPRRGVLAGSSRGGRRFFGIDRRVLHRDGLLSTRGGERFSGEVTFPISDRRGRSWASAPVLWGTRSRST